MRREEEKFSGPTTDRGISRLGTNYGLHITLARLLVLAIVFVALSYLI